jgi:hypothetical protein
MNGDGFNNSSLARGQAGQNHAAITLASSWKRWMTSTPGGIRDFGNFAAVSALRPMHLARIEAYGHLTGTLFNL